MSETLIEEKNFTTLKLNAQRSFIQKRNKEKKTTKKKKTLF